MTQYVIIGSGAAGISAAETIRAQDPQGAITLISDEQAGYYSRPGLAYLLANEVPEKFLFPFRESDFDRLNVDRLQARVIQIHPDAHEITLEDRHRLSYDRLLIATGAQAHQPQMPGMDLKGVVKLDSLAETKGIIALTRRSRGAVVIGGGITALELVEGLRARGVKTHYFLRQDRYWGNVLDETESKIVEQRLQEDGVHIHYHTELGEILGRRGRVLGVVTTDGRQISCDILGIAIGIRPRLELAKSSSLEIERGILVDPCLQTSAPDVFAAGDVAQVYDPISGKHVLDSLWGPAREQGRAAGMNMVGVGSPYHKGVAFNVTRLAGLTTTIIGTVGGGRDTDLLGIARGDSETWRQLPDAISAQSDFDVNRLRVMVGDRTLIGAIVMGDQTLSQPLQRLVVEQADILPIREKLLEPDAPLADLISDFWTIWKREHAAG